MILIFFQQVLIPVIFFSYQPGSSFQASINRLADALMTHELLDSSQLQQSYDLLFFSCSWVTSLPINVYNPAVLQKIEDKSVHGWELFRSYNSWNPASVVLWLLDDQKLEALGFQQFLCFPLITGIHRSLTSFPGIYK